MRACQHRVCQKAVLPSVTWVTHSHLQILNLVCASDHFLSVARMPVKLLPWLLLSVGQEYHWHGLCTWCLPQASALTSIFWITFVLAFVLISNQSLNLSLASIQIVSDSLQKKWPNWSLQILLPKGIYSVLELQGSLGMRALAVSQILKVLIPGSIYILMLNYYLTVFYVLLPI